MIINKASLLKMIMPNPTQDDLRNDQEPPLNGPLVHSGFDKASAEGHHVLHVFTEEMYTPVVFRDNKKFVSVRMAEKTVLGEFLNLLHPELYNCIKIPAHYVTIAEIKLLNYINEWHWDMFFGPEKFTEFDKLISLDDLTKFLEFLRFAFAALHSGGKNGDNDYSRCGFAKINNDDTVLLPYTVLSSEKIMVPTFYFNFESAALEGKVQLLEDWSLAYLKVCFAVQKVKKEIISKSTMEVVSLADIQEYFGKSIKFETKCWPQPKPKSLFSKRILKNIVYNTGPQVSSDRWTIVKNYVSEIELN